MEEWEWLDLQRALVRWKCEDADPMVDDVALDADPPGRGARHVGHLDTIRELLDGEKGYY